MIYHINGTQKNTIEEATAATIALAEKDVKACGMLLLTSADRDDIAARIKALVPGDMDVIYGADVEASEDAKVASDVDEERMTVTEVQDGIMALIDGEAIDDTVLAGASTNSYENAGVMNKNAGFELFTLDGSRFQVTIVRVG